MAHMSKSIIPAWCANLIYQEGFNRLPPILLGIRSVNRQKPSPLVKGIMLHGEKPFLGCQQLDYLF